jgi:phage anti-repressor protein
MSIISSISNKSVFSGCEITYEQLENEQNLWNINTFIEKTNYDLDKLYIDQFWNSYKNDNDWIELTEELIRWMGYEGEFFKAKYNILQNIKNNYILNIDYKIDNPLERINEKEGKKGRKENIIFIKYVCLKLLCMTLKTNKGDQIRKYFISIETLFKDYWMYQNFHNTILKDNQIFKMKELSEKSKKELKEEQKEKLKIKKNHESLLKRREYYKFNRGPCFYSWHNPLTPNLRKVGMTNEDINERLRAERTGIPNLHIDCIIYLDKAHLLEQNILTKYKSKLQEINHEILIDLKLEKLIKSCHGILKWLNYEEYTEEKELWKYNNEEPPEEEHNVEENEQKEEKQIINIDTLDNSTNIDQSTTNNIDNSIDQSKVNNIDQSTTNMTNPILINPIINITIDKSSFVCPYPDCNKEYSRKDILKKHIDVVHLNIKKEYKCKYDGCDKVCNSSGSLYTHVNKIHKKVKFTCECGTECSTKSILTRHQQCSCKLKNSSTC